MDNQSVSCKESIKVSTKTECEKQESVTSITKSTSSNLHEEDKASDDASQKTSISNQPHQHVPMACVDQNEEQKITTRPLTNNISQSNSTSNATRVNATTSTPPAQLVVTFSTDTIVGSNSGDIKA